MRKDPEIMEELSNWYRNHRFEQQSLQDYPELTFEARQAEDRQEMPQTTIELQVSERRVEHAIGSAQQAQDIALIY